MPILQHGSIGVARRVRARIASPGRLSLLFWSTLYFGLLAYVYVYRMERWDYLGFWYGGTDVQSLTACYLLAIMPLAWMRTRIEWFSTFTHWIIYLFVYIPAVLIPMLQGLTTDVLALSFAIFVSFAAITLFHPLSIGSSSRWHPSREVFWGAFWAIYVAMLIYALYVFRDNLTLSSFYDVYGQRSVASDVAAGTGVGYATGVLSGCLNPFLMAIGLRYRRLWLFAIALVGQILVYATFALKSAPISILVLCVFYFVLLRHRVVRIWKLAAMICGSIAIPLLMLELVGIDQNPLVENIVALVLMRTYAMVGALTGIYYEFFSRNDFTYFSHINLVRQFVDYPYSVSLGEVIGESLGLDMNANANFFAADGIAAAGKLGVVIVGAIVGLILNVIDRVVPPTNHRLLCICFAPIAISLANTSVFTTLLTGGLILLVLLTIFWRDSLLRDPIKNFARPGLQVPINHATV
jgi:hypothetical protein